MKLDSCLKPHSKLSKNIKDLNVRPKMLKILEENAEGKLLDTYFDDLLGVTTKVQTTGKATIS